DGTGAGARLAADGHHQRRLAGAVGADQRDDLAAVDVDVDAAQRDDLAVIGLDPAHGQQRAPRRVAHRPSPALPLPTTLPLALPLPLPAAGAVPASVFAWPTQSSRSMRPGKAR